MALPLTLTPAWAQPAPDGCLQDPASCVPEAPDLPPPPPVDECLQNPASCLPEPPEVDPCVADPASCLPEPPPVDECTADPQSCLPESPEVDACVQKPADCLPASGEERDPQTDGGQGNEQDQDERGSPAPVKRDGPTGRSNGASDTSGRGTRTTAAITGPQPTASPLDGAPVAGELSAPGLLDRVRQGLADAAQRFAFPMGVAALAGVFLLVQGRLDRKDPKLTAAPIDSRDDVVTFR